MKPRKWTIEKITEEAMKYQSRYEFQRKSYAYSAAYKKGLLDEICKHMKIQWEKKWDLESILIESLKYKTKGEFALKNRSAYNAAKKHGYINECCKHMKKLRHYWSVEELKEEALKYKTRTNFFKKNTKAYSVSIKRQILDQVCSHMLPATNTSSSEKTLLTTIKQLHPKAQKLVDRKVKIANKPYIKGFDIDIYIPELRKGIEFDGIYFHSLKGLKRGRPNWPKQDIENYHQIKDEYFKSKGVEILHIKEKDWIKDPENEIKKCMEFLK